MNQCTEQDKWQEFISRGNTEFSLQYFGNAILMYHNALEDARFRVKSLALTSHDKAISKVVISFFSLANCYIKLNEIDRACDYYIQAQKFLIRLGQENVDKSGDLVAAITHADLHLDSVWTDFIKNHHDHVAYDRMLQFHKSSLRLKNEASNRMLHHTLH